MNKVVNWFLLLIIFVFDPLAIALVVAANFAFAQIKPKFEVEMSVPEGMEFNKSYPMPKSWLDPKDEEYDPTEGIKEMLKKEKATEKKYTIYGEEYTTEELRSLSKNLPTGDKSMAEFNRHLKDGNIK